MNTNLADNSVNGISAADERDLLEDIIDSAANKLDDAGSLSGLDDYDTNTSYEPGQACFYLGKLYRCTATTTGAWDAADWEEVANSRVLVSDPAQNGNATAAESVLTDYTLPADTLDKNNQRVEVHAWGTTTADANNKRLRLYLGATVIFDSASAAANNDFWDLEATIIRQTANAQQVIVKFRVSNGGAWTETITYNGTSEDLTTALYLRCTGEGSNPNEVLQFGHTVTWFKEG